MSFTFLDYTFDLTFILSGVEDLFTLLAPILLLHSSLYLFALLSEWHFVTLYDKIDYKLGFSAPDLPISVISKQYAAEAKPLSAKVACIEAPSARQGAESSKKLGL
jgi:hypothetical protein